VVLRRVVLDGTGAVRVEDWPEAAALVPGPTDLLIEPDRVGICATDLELADGSLVYLRQGLARLPITPGHEWTGIVISAGDGVVGFRRGDRVVGEPHLNCGACPTCLAGRTTLCPNRREFGIMYCDGAMASRFVFPAAHAHKLATSVDARDAALVEPLAVALRAVRRLAPGSGQEVAVVGCGTIGCLVVMLCAARGISVRAVDKRADRQAMAESCGARPVVSDQLYPFVVEASGAPAGVIAGFQLLETAGVLLALGLTGADLTPIPLDALVVGDQTCIGSLGSAGVWPEAISLIESGAVQRRKLVTHQFPLDRAADALQLLRDQGRGVGKVLITVP
jgi:L-iditol 2-dehydrogenase